MSQVLLNIEFYELLERGEIPDDPALAPFVECGRIMRDAYVSTRLRQLEEKTEIGAEAFTPIDGSGRVGD